MGWLGDRSYRSGAVDLGHGQEINTKRRPQTLRADHANEGEEEKECAETWESTMRFHGRVSAPSGSLDGSLMLTMKT